MRFPAILRRRSKHSAVADTVDAESIIRELEKDEKTAATGNGSVSLVDSKPAFSIRVEEASLSTEGSPAMEMTDGPMLVDKLPHQYERERSDAGAGEPVSTAGERSTKRAFRDKLMSLAQEHLDEIPESRRAFLLKNAPACTRSFSSGMHVTPAFPIMTQDQYIDSPAERASGSSVLGVARVATGLFTCNGCDPASYEADPDYEDEEEHAEGTVEGSYYFGGRSYNSPLLAHHGGPEESLDRIYVNGGAHKSTEIGRVHSPHVSDGRGDHSLVRDHLMQAQKEAGMDDDWGDSTISSRVTNYMDQFDNMH